MALLETSLDMPLRQIIQIMQSRIMTGTTYFGIPALKSPQDWWVYQELIFKTQPDVIIEIGTYLGGSALGLAHMCDNLGKGRVITIDINATAVELAKKHHRIQFLVGDACKLFPQVQSQIKPTDQVMVIEDSAHTYENTLNVLKTYSPLVKVGGYFIVEDGNIGHGLTPFNGDDPYTAITAFLAGNPSFVADRGQEGFLVTWNPQGFLKRIR